MTRDEAIALLGLPTPFSKSQLRMAYHRRARETHPDACPDALAHPKMIELNQAYSLLSAAAPPLDYELYKRATQILEKIHPSSWTRVTVEGLFDPSAIESKLEISEAIRSALERIDEAHLKFSEVLRDYPDSPWAADSRDKVEWLDKLRLRYQRMAEHGTRRFQEKGTR